MDNTADMLTRIRNAIRAKNIETDVIYSKKNKSILDVLKREGYIEDYSEISLENNKKLLKVALKYKRNIPVIKSIKLKSRQRCRIYSSIKDLPLVYNGLGISIIYTSKGVLSDIEARTQNVGGEVVCEIF